MQVLINALLTDAFAAETEHCIISEDQLFDQKTHTVKVTAVERYSWTRQGNWTEHKISCSSGANDGLFPRLG